LLDGRRFRRVTSALGPFVSGVTTAQSKSFDHPGLAAFDACSTSGAASSRATPSPS